MRFVASLFTAACILAIGNAASKTAAASSSQTAQRTHKRSSNPTRSTTFAPTGFTNTSSGACASVSAMIHRSPEFQSTLAVVQITGQDANAFLQKTGQSLSNFNNPDAT
ncbi:hypothetical protein BPOR_0597g00090 [Botrytis porri]|uniref:Uncharacterized protein n=2 Tax=Botrytis porri TaxID=87229 RepID=A0A4Z1KEA6_9HELO|nr:hypothetical protein BPOR_0597g00090 [Botrytis porri]